jgi:hypothetical protein
VPEARQITQPGNHLDRAWSMSHEIAEAPILSDALGDGGLKNHIQRREVAVDIGEDSYSQRHRAARPNECPKGCAKIRCMGVNITGHVEVRTVQRRPDSGWAKALDLDVLLWGDDKNYPIYKCLFGEVAPRRGLPLDVTEDVRLAADESGDLSWITWGEISRLDSTRLPDELAAMVQAVQNGSPIAVPRSQNPSPGWRASDESMSTWQRILSMMWILADCYGDDDVRMIVWFV